MSEFSEFLVDYYQGYHEGKRLGEAFLDFYYKDDVDVILFNMVNRRDTINYIMKKYINVN